MLRYEFTVQQVQNLKALIMDANIKGSAAVAIAELIRVLDNPVDRVCDNDLHGEHNDKSEKVKDEP